MTQYSSPYKALGADGIRNLVDHFYDLMDSSPSYSALRKMHAADLSGIRTRLSDYLVGWMGGPQLYLEKHGSVCMTGPHKAFWIGPDERDQWVACMYEAMDSIVMEDQVKEMLRKPLYNLADAVRNQEVSKPALSVSR